MENVLSKLKILVKIEIFGQNWNY